MPTNAPIRFNNGTLPEGFCFTSWQTTFNTFTSLLSGYLPGAYNTFNFGNTEPAADDRGKPWFRLHANGSPDKWYVYWMGGWVSPFPVETGSSEIRIWKGLLADLVDLDGGSAGAVTDTTGPFWEEDVSMRGLFPIGAGTLASGTVIGANDTGGEEKHTLTIAELAPHSHFAFDDGTNSGGSSIVGAGIAAARHGGGSNSDYSIRTSAETDAIAGKTSTTGGTGTPAVASPHSNIPPYRGVIFYKRTARLFFTP